MKFRIEKASTLSNFLEIISKIITEWSSSETGEVRPWYRGQKRADWSLLPGEYRYQDINFDELRSEFMLKSRPLLDHVPVNDWEWYFLMQHYGLPTRLLDWTVGALIALHFALCQNTGDYDAAVWILDPWELNRWNYGVPELILTPDKQAQSYLYPPYVTKKLSPKPIAVIPPYNSSRITVQRGAFTVHGGISKGIEAQFSTRLVQIVIPKKSCIQTRRDLRNAGISEFTVFPDLDGLSRDIRFLQIDGC